MRWLVTGGCGFIGVNFVKALAEEGGHTVIVLDNFLVGSPDDLARAVSFRWYKKREELIDQSSSQFKCFLVEGDILDSGLLNELAKFVDVVVHLAANTGVGPSVEDPLFDGKINMLGTLNCLEAARHGRVRRFVFASSGAPVGVVNPPISESIVPRPVSPYGASKLAGEGYCSAYYHSFGLEAVALRFGNVYGPLSGHKSSVVAKFIKAIFKGRGLEIYGDGSQTRDFIFVEDLVRAIRKASEAEQVGGEVFQIATNREVSVSELVRLLDKKFKELNINVETNIRYSEKRVGDVQRNYSDISKAVKVLGWSPQCGLDRGIELTIKYFLAAEG